MVTHRRQADGRTRTHAQVHRRLSYGHQGIRHIGSHYREAACSMGPHGYRLTCLGASLSVPAPHSLRTANFGAVEPMCQSGGSCVCRALLWLAIGLHTVQWAAEACLAAVGLMYCEFGCMLASYGAPTVLEACIEHCRGCVSGGLRGQNGTCSLYQSHSTFSWMCTARTEAMVTIAHRTSCTL